MKYYDIECLQNNHKEILKIEYPKINDSLYRHYLNHKIIALEVSTNKVGNNNNPMVGKLPFNIEAVEGKSK